MAIFSASLTLSWSKRPIPETQPIWRRTSEPVENRSRRQRKRHLPMGDSKLAVMGWGTACLTNDEGLNCRRLE